MCLRENLLEAEFHLACVSGRCTKALNRQIEKKAWLYCVLLAANPESIEFRTCAHPDPDKKMLGEHWGVMFEH